MEHLQREGDSQCRGGPFGGHAMCARGYRSAQRQFISSILTSKSNNRLRVTDAPGFYAAFPWGGYAQSKGATGPRSNLAHALYIPLSLPPHLPTPGRLFGHGGNIDREVHRGPPPGASGEGGSSLHGPISAMHRTQRAPFDEKHAHQRRP